MNYQTIAEIYQANDAIRENLKSVVGNLTKEEADFLPAGGKWTVAAIMEHLAMVEEGMTKISARLLSKAESAGKKSDGKVKISKEFVEQAIRVETERRKLVAPEMVQPKGSQTIAESIKKMEANRVYLNNLKTKFEEFDGTAFTFPHPAFGELTAQDWLTLLGEHEKRHMKQIKKILADQ